jgi:hypothetical protein
MSSEKEKMIDPYEMPAGGAVDKAPENLIVQDAPANDPVHHPAHYTRGAIEPIDYINSWNFNFNVGNSIKYLTRMDLKNNDGGLEDLQKVLWYVCSEMKRRGFNTELKFFLEKELKK